MDTIKEMMQEKSDSFKFLLAVQSHDYEKAYQIGKEILQVNPNDQTVNRFMLFLQQNMGYLDGLFDFDEEDEEFEIGDEEEEEEEEEVYEEDEEEEEEEQEEEEDDSEYEWVYEEDEGFDQDAEFLQEDTNEGDISLNMDQKIKEKQELQQASNKLPPKRVIQQIKPKSSIPNGVPTLPKIQQKSRPNSQSKQQIQKPQPQQQNLVKQTAAVNQLRFPSSMAKKK